MRHFNTEGTCIPSRHYMVDMKDRIAATLQMVEEGEYFYIQRPRQYGKTTMLKTIARQLRNNCLVIELNFQQFVLEDYADTNAFLSAIWETIQTLLYNGLVEMPDELKNEITQTLTTSPVNYVRFGRWIKQWGVSLGKPVVLLVDELDRASSERVVREFLGFLRGEYLDRDDMVPTFHSVILAGVTDIVYLKSVIRKEEEHREDSPWNIAADYDLVDLAFSATDVEQMLDTYEADHHYGMDVISIAEEVIWFTNGYPYLVSRICKIIDERLLVRENWEVLEAWSVVGVREAAKRIVQEKNTLFDSMLDKLNSYPDIKLHLGEMLLYGDSLSFHVADTAQRVLLMYGFLRVNGNQVWVSNRIFETWLYNMYINADIEMAKMIEDGKAARSSFVDGEHLNMHAVLDSFALLYEEVYHNQVPAFLEKEGRKLFITYLRGKINGTGHYAVEDASRDSRNTDLIVFYKKDRYVVELKIWDGNAYERKGLEQLADYLESYHLDLGYLLTFSFLKKKEIRRNARSHQVKGKTILEWIV